MKKGTSVYLRFSNGRMFDVTASTSVMVDPKNWDKQRQKIKNVATVTNREKLNEKLSLLKLYIVNSFNTSFVSGEAIDKQWLDKNIKTFFNRPTKEGNEGKHLIYLSDFAKWWLDNKADGYKVNANKRMDGATKSQYEQALDNLIEYQGKQKVKLKDVGVAFFDGLSDFLTSDMQYAHATARRKLARIKFFCARAEQENIQVHKGYSSRVYVDKKETDYKHPYLNESEIKLVFDYVSDDEILNVERDNWIIGLWTGLRVSDFLTRLDMSNIDGDFIEIRTKKTGTSVAIPIHWQVKEVLKRYGGKLPPKISNQDFNDAIKIIAKDIGMDEIMLGGIAIKKNGKTRKIVGQYPKWKLITSHVCRRSFCTNLFGKVSNQVIMNIAGWSNERQMMSYNKATSRESAIKLKEHWELNKT